MTQSDHAVSADLVEFLKARLDDDQRTARQLHAKTCGHDATTIDAACDCDWHVGRVFAEVASKRAIVDRYEMASMLERGPIAQPVSINTPAFRLEKSLAKVTRSGA